jgi:hypothetical protein
MKKNKNYLFNFKRNFISKKNFTSNVIIKTDILYENFIIRKKLMIQMLKQHNTN